MSDLEQQSVENSVEPTQQPETQVNNELNNTQSRDWEAEARQMGWTDNFKGDPNKFIDAKTFVEKGENQMPLMKAEIKELREKTKERDEFLKKIADNNKYLREQLDLERQRNLDKSINQAFEDGDREKHSQLLKERDDFVKQQKQFEFENKQNIEPTQPSIPTEIVSWVENNYLYKTDVNYKQRADVEFEYICKINSNNTVQQNLNLLTSRMQEINRPKFNAVGGGQTIIAQSSNKKTYSDLPENAKTMCKQFVRSGLFKSEQDYINEYFNQ